MLDITRPLRELLQTNPVDSTNSIWRLHSRVTVFMLAFFCILLSARAYFGGPIDCISGSDSVRASMNSFCWILGTFISKDPNFVNAKWDYIEIGTKMGNIPPEERFYQKYYQWVSLLLAIQAFFFSLPKHVWLFYEGNRIRTLCHDLVCILPPAAWNPVRKHDTLQYLVSESRYKHSNYAFIFFACECLNFVIVILNMLLLNFIFGGFWNSYHPAVRALFSLDMNSWSSYNSLVFPKLAKCDFRYVGPSGSQQMVDALCLLPHNILNEKIFAFLWLWFILLSIISAFQLCYRMTQLCCQSIRVAMLYSQLEPISYHRVKRVVRESSIGHWFLLYQMARNINKHVMVEIVTDLAKAYLERSQSKLSIEVPHQIAPEEQEFEEDEVTV